jgi:uncharacterized protein with HEPN domain
MQPEARALLWDVLDAARFIQESTDNLSFEEYNRNRLLRSAVERQFEIVGEAVRRLTTNDRATAAKLSGVSQMIAFRNVLAHGYDVVDHARVWEIIHRDIPVLIHEADALLHVPPDDL